MLGIGADHKNSVEGLAWKQNKDFENLLRRLNAANGDEPEEAPMKIDGFTKGASMTTVDAEKDTVSSGDEHVGAEPKEEKRSKKKRRKESKSGLPDPEKDEELSEQAKKGTLFPCRLGHGYQLNARNSLALSYAYLQAEEPSSWKFNKARQNWLLRNIWSEESVSRSLIFHILRAQIVPIRYLIRTFH